MKRTYLEKIESDWIDCVGAVTVADANKGVHLVDDACEAFDEAIKKISKAMENEKLEYHPRTDELIDLRTRLEDELRFHGL